MYGVKKSISRAGFRWRRKAKDYGSRDADEALILQVGSFVLSAVKAPMQQETCQLLARIADRRGMDIEYGNVPSAPSGLESRVQALEHTVALHEDSVIYWEKRQSAVEEYVSEHEIALDCIDEHFVNLASPAARQPVLVMNPVPETLGAVDDQVEWTSVDIPTQHYLPNELLEAIDHMAGKSVGVSPSSFPAALGSQHIAGVLNEWSSSMAPSQEVPPMAVPDDLQVCMDQGSALIASEGDVQFESLLMQCDTHVGLRDSVDTSAVGGYKSKERSGCEYAWNKHHQCTTLCRNFGCNGSCSSSQQQEAEPTKSASSFLELREGANDGVPRCAKGHALVKKIARKGQFFCDVCGHDIKAKKVLLDCRECDFCLCGRCLERVNPSTNKYYWENAPQKIADMVEILENARWNKRQCQASSFLDNSSSESGGEGPIGLTGLD